MICRFFRKNDRPLATVAALRSADAKTNTEHVLKIFRIDRQTSGAVNEQVNVITINTLAKL